MLGDFVGATSNVNSDRFINLALPGINLKWVVTDYRYNNEQKPLKTITCSQEGVHAINQAFLSSNKQR